MKRKNMLNNIMLENARKSPAYQCLMTDLVLSGAISRSIGEKLLGYTIPSYLRLPKDFSATQPAPAPSGTGSSGTGSSGTGSSGTGSSGTGSSGTGSSGTGSSGTGSSGTTGD